MSLPDWSDCAISRSMRAFVQGELAWNFADFQTTEGIMRVDGNHKGVFTRDRQPKAAAVVFKDRWEKKNELF